MNKRIFSIAALVSFGLSASAWGQVAKPGQSYVPAQASGGGALLQGQEQSINRQASGNFPAFQRSLIPLGLMYDKWAEKCKASSSVTSLLYKPDEELRVRARQMDGVVLRFGEKVAPMVKGAPDVVEVVPWGKGDVSRIWIVKALVSGALTNLTFVGGRIAGGERIYSIRLQTEAVNTKNCPDLIVNIRTPGDDIKDRARAAVEKLDAEDRKTSRGAVQSPGMTTAAPDRDEGPVTQGSGDKPGHDGTGRQETDWIYGEKFDPTEISHDWRTRAKSTAGLEIAPDVVYSDSSFMYLKYKNNRLKRVLRPSVSLVRTIRRGGKEIKTDSQVRASWRGDVLVVQGVGPLTLEVEGVVVCIEPVGALTEPVDRRQLVGVEG
tara:strand:+ start:137 stop:1270 length:1134 start_codon:yes stop_codon:yes gene_type:complete